MAKYIIGVIFIILLTGGGYYFLMGKMEAQEPVPTTETVQELPPAPTTQTFASSTFTAVYPIGWSVDERYAYMGVSEKKPIMGVKFQIPLEVATGTNLSTESYVSVEMLPRATSCTGDIYVLPNVKPSVQVVNGRTYSVATTSEGAAGSTIEEWVFAVSDSKPCTAVRYVIRSAQMGNFPPGSVQEFNKSALIAEFDKIRDSLTLGAASAVPATSTPTATQ